MARIIVTTSASADQGAILNHLHAKAGLGTVVKFRSLFAALYDRLADHPASGPRRTALGSNIRIGIVNEQSRIRDRLRQTSARLKTMARVNRALYLNPRDAVEYLRSPRRLDARLERFFSSIVDFVEIGRCSLEKARGRVATGNYRGCWLVDFVSYRCGHLRPRSGSQNWAH